MLNWCRPSSSSSSTPSSIWKAHGVYLEDACLCRKIISGTSLYTYLRYLGDAVERFYKLRWKFPEEVEERRRHFMAKEASSFVQEKSFADAVNQDGIGNWTWDILRRSLTSLQFFCATAEEVTKVLLLHVRFIAATVQGTLYFHVKTL